jgi:uncharacterized membrane protein YidH (DUF202 family)
MKQIITFLAIVVVSLTAISMIIHSSASFFLSNDCDKRKKLQNVASNFLYVSYILTIVGLAMLFIKILISFK